LPLWTETFATNSHRPPPCLCARGDHWNALSGWIVGRAAPIGNELYVHKQTANQRPWPPPHCHRLSVGSASAKRAICHFWSILLPLKL
jgi:hypothetical protein